MYKDTYFTENLNLNVEEKQLVHSNKPSTELSSISTELSSTSAELSSTSTELSSQIIKRPQQSSEVWVTDYLEKLDGDFKNTHENRYINTTLTRNQEKVNQQALVGIAVVIIALTLISLITLVVHTVKSYKKKRSKDCMFDRCNLDKQIDNKNSQFTQINRNNFKSNQAKNEALSNLLNEHIYNSVNKEGLLLQNARHCSCTKTNGRDYSNRSAYRASDEGYYSNGGTVVHV